MSSPAKSKGNKFERDMAKVLSEWWGEEFRRTPLSGGWGEACTTGDIVSVSPKSTFPFSVECKRNEAFKFNTFFQDNNTALFNSWWKQCCLDAKKAKKLPLLLTKINRNEPLAICYISALVERPYTFILSEAGIPLTVCLLKYLIQKPKGVILEQAKGSYYTQFRDYLNQDTKDIK